MKKLFAAVVYTALVIGANAAVAAGPDMLRDLAQGDMKKLVIEDDPAPVSDVAFTDADGAEHALSDHAGKVLLVNFWATWCAPCREEMPALDALSAEMGGDDFAVVPIATGRNSLDGIHRFFEEEGVENLPVYLDPNQALAREMAVLGLPVSVLVDREGREVARLMGDADWAGADARAVIRALMGEGAETGTEADAEGDAATEAEDAAAQGETPEG